MVELVLVEVLDVLNGKGLPLVDVAITGTFAMRCPREACVTVSGWKNGRKRPFSLRTEDEVPAVRNLGG
jgi:hypothetical protein